MSNGSIITGWTAPVGGASAGDYITVSTSQAKEEGIVAFYGGASCAFTGLAEISPKGFDNTDDECGLSTGQSIEWNNKKTVVYTGPRTGLDASEYLDEFNDASNWSVYSSSNTDYDNTNSFSIESGSNQNAASTCTVYSEDFESYPDNYGWGNNGSNSGGFDGTETNWSLSGDSNGDYWYVNTVSSNNVFEGKDLDGESIWTSKSISVSGLSDLTFSIDVSQSAYDEMESADYIRVYAIADGGTESLLFEQTNDLSSATTWSSSVSASSTIQFRVKARNSDNDERWQFDNLELIAVSTDTDSDGLCDVVDDCTDTAAANYTDPAAIECAYVILNEPFDDDSQFSKNVNFSHDGSADYWGIYDPDGSGDDFDGNSGQPSGVGSFSGVDGKFLVGEDMDQAPVVADPGILTWSNIDISAYDADLTFELDIAERGATSDEFVELYAKLSSASTYTLLIDPGASIGSIGSTFSTQSASGSFDGTSLDIQLRMYSDDGNDEVAVDNLRVLGTISCSVDVDSDGLCDDNNGDGCTNTSACNYADPSATSCEVPTGCEICSTSDGNGTIVDNDVDNDGVCDNSGDGCTDTSACNWNDTNATSCSFATGCDFCSTSDGNGTVVDNDVDGDGLCDDNGDGCTDTNACNYAVPSASSCVYLDGVCETCVNGEVVDNDADNDGVCDADEVTGCTDSSACNYDDDPTTDTNNGLCVYATGACESCSGETDGTGTVVVTDTTAPTITPQAGVTVFADGSCQVSAAGVLLGEPATSDNCGVKSYSNDAPAVYLLGETTVTWTVIDDSDNTATATQTVTVVDSTAPTAVANAITLNVASEGQSVSLSADNGSFNGSSDNCSFTSLVKIVGSGADYASSVTFTATGTYSVTLQVTDLAGNSATSTAVVTVAILAVDGCIDPTACNYDASANTDDGTCHYPGQECQSPSAGQGFIYTVNTGLTGCDCSPQDFDVVYFEDFGPGAPQADRAEVTATRVHGFQWKRHRGRAHRFG